MQMHLYAAELELDLYANRMPWMILLNPTSVAALRKYALAQSLCQRRRVGCCSFTAYPQFPYAFGFFNPNTRILVRLWSVLQDGTVEATLA
jgi:hypothetical protein